jgi:hypothetical protein
MRAVRTTNQHVCQHADTDSSGGTLLVVSHRSWSRLARVSRARLVVRSMADEVALDQLDLLRTEGVAAP